MTPIEELLDVVTPDGGQPPSADSIRMLISRRRARRRMTAVAAVFLLVLAGSLLVVAQSLGTGGDDSMRIESVEDPDDVDESEDGATDRDGEQSVVVSEVESTGVPGEIGQLLSDGQRFFVLERGSGESNGFRRDVGYIFDGDSWTEGSVGGRPIASDIQSDGDGTLFVLTETVGTGLPELGRSYDGGVTWDWLQIEADFEPFYDPRASLGSFAAPRVVSQDGAQLVILSRPSRPRYSHARALIKEAIGIDIGDMGNEASRGHATLEGVELTRVPQSAFTSTVCDEALSQAWNDSGLRSGPVPGVEPPSVAEVFEPVQDVDGCRERAECAQLVASRLASGTALAASLQGSSIPYAALDALDLGYVEPLACQEGLDVYGYGYDSSVAETEFITWEEMGVEVPESWYGEVVGVLVEGSAMTDLGELFPLGDQTVVGAMAGPDGYSIITSAWRGGDEEVGMIWSSGPDLDTWTSRPISAADLNWLTSETWESDAVVADGARMRIDYSIDPSPAVDRSDPEDLFGALRSKLVRWDDNGTTTEMPMAEIAPELVGTHVFSELAAGQLGVVMVAEPVGPIPGTSTVLLVSTDEGTTWSTSNVDGFVHQLVVGDEAVMMVVSPSPSQWEQPVSFVITTLE